MLVREDSLNTLLQSSQLLSSALDVLLLLGGPSFEGSDNVFSVDLLGVVICDGCADKGEGDK